MVKKLIYLIIVSIALRLGISYFQYSGDVKNHMVWGEGFISQSVNFYSRHFFGFNDPNYPPATIFIFSGVVQLYHYTKDLIQFLNMHIGIFPSFLVPLFQTEHTQMAFLKIPGILSDIGIGIILYKILLKKRTKKPLLLTSLYLFNPAVIYISAVWGQIESITLFFVFYSLFLALFCPKIRFLSLVAFFLAVLTKQTALWLAPILFILWFKELRLRDWVIGMVAGLALFFLSFLPFGLTPTQALTGYLSTLSGSSNFVSDSAWNLWFYFFPIGTPDSVLLGVLSVRTISIIFLLMILVFLCFHLFTKYSTNRLFAYLFIWSLAAFFLQTRVHERHLAPAIVFLLLIPNLGSRYFIDYFLLSAYHMYNLYWSLRLPFI